MSFILDALRKSESERRIEAVPQVMQVPVVARHRQKLPSWATAVIAALAVALLLVTTMAWFRAETDRAEETAAPVDGTPSPIARPDPARTAADPNGIAADPARSVSAPSVSAPSERAAEGAGGPTDRLASAGARSSETTTAPVPARTQAASEDATRGEDYAGLPSAAELASQGIAIPALDLQLHVTSAVASRRFVLINGRRYAEGDRLAEGPDVIAITSEGVVLQYSGREFLLVAN